MAGSAIAFVFPGQGSQRLGMGRELQVSDPDLFDRWLGLADSVSGLPVTRHALEGPLEALTDTQVAQPAIFAVSLALAEKAREVGIQPEALAGHSLGEYSAAVAGGALAPEAGMLLVCERGRLMAEVQQRRPGSMAAVSGLTVDQLEEICRRAADVGVVVVANLNSDRQAVVSGETAAVDRATGLALQAGAEQATRLQVGAAFHSPLMRPVQAELARVVDSLSWRDTELPIYANFDARPVRRAADVRKALLAQIAAPVRWADCVRALQADYRCRFLELGPGRVLTGLIRLHDPDADAFAADSSAKLQRFLAS